MPTPPSTPLSSPGIFNVLDPWYDAGGGVYQGMVANDPTMATQNTNVLNQIIKIAQTIHCASGNPPYGAIILFPGHSRVPGQDDSGADNGGIYWLAVPDGAPSAIKVGCNWPLRFLGTGNAKLKINYDPPDFPNNGSIFNLNTAQGDNSGGITFEDLTFEYDAVDESMGIPQYCAINGGVTSGVQNLRVVCCVFNDAPIGIWLLDALECSIHQCYFEYAQNAGIAIKIGTGELETDTSNAKQVFITDCLLNGGDVSHGGDTEPVGCTAVWILGSDHVRMVDCMIDSFQNGVYIAPGYAGAAVRHTFTACTVYTGTDGNQEMGSAVYIKPLLSSTAVSQIVFEGCYFEFGDQAAPTTDVPGVLIDASAGPIDNIRFISCHSLQWSGPGLQINGGYSRDGFVFPTNIEILGGMYAGNLYSHGGYTSVHPYGIWVGTSTGVRIIGASCIGVYEQIELGYSPTPTNQQAIGIVVEGGASDVVIDACDVTGNSDNGILVDATASAVAGVYIRNCNATGYSPATDGVLVATSGTNADSVQITDVAGYNDLGTEVSGSAISVTLGTPFYAYQYGYYGPVTFYVASNAVILGVLVGGHTLPLKFGTFILAPGVSGKITGTGPSIPITMIGQ